MPKFHAKIKGLFVSMKMQQSFLCDTPASLQTLALIRGSCYQMANLIAL